MYIQNELYKYLTHTVPNTKFNYAYKSNPIIISVGFFQNVYRHGSIANGEAINLLVIVETNQEFKSDDTSQDPAWKTVEQLYAVYTVQMEGIAFGVDSQNVLKIAEHCDITSAL